MASTADRQQATSGTAQLAARVSALRQAAALPGAQLRPLLDAALAELGAALDALGAADPHRPGEPDDTRLHSAAGSERRLLHAVFQQTPVPLFLLGRDGIIRRANSAAGLLLGVGPGYAAGKLFTALIEPSGRAVVQSRLAAVARSAQPGQLDCSLLAATGRVRCELAVRPITVRGGDDQLLVAVSGRRPAAGTKGTRGRAAGQEPAVTLPQATLPQATLPQATPSGPGPADAVSAVVTQMTRRLDLATAVTRLLLENITSAESVTLQRCARLLAGELMSWVIVDLAHRGVLQRHFVTGPDEHGSAQLAQAAAAMSPDPGSVPYQVSESGGSMLITHAEDAGVLGAGHDGVPLLVLLQASSVLCVPLSDGKRTHGVLTLARHETGGHFDLADVGLVEEIAEQLALALSVRRLLRQRTETAQALQASLLPPALRAVPGVEIAAAHLASTGGDEVGGDFYDVYPTPGTWGVSIGDVSGQGEDAAAVTAAARHAVRVLAHRNDDPAEVLRGANDIMLAEDFGGRFVTADAAHLSWDGRTLRVRLASAGHPGPVLLRPDGRAQLMAGGGLPLGVFADAEPATMQLELARGDVLFFYTDGLTAARSPSQARFEDSLADTLSTLAGQPPADIVSGMRALLLDFCAGVLRDGLTMLALRAGEPPDG